MLGWFWLNFYGETPVEIKINFSYSITVNSKLPVGPEKQMRVKLLFQLFHGIFHNILPAVGCMAINNFVSSIKPGDLNRFNRDQLFPKMYQECFFV